MNRPYVFCHMLTSIDGKIMGNYMDTPESNIAGKAFYDIAFGKERYYKHQGWLSGRITTDDNFTFYKKPVLDENAPIVPEGDFIADYSEKIHYVSIDPSGKLGWERNYIVYQDTRAHVIEVLTKRVDNSYKAFLRKLGISYIIAGEDSLNYELVLKKLKEIFGIENLMLGGGGILNWSFLQAGLCDEISVIVAATTDGSIKTPTLFMTAEGITEDKPLGFALKSVKVLEGDAIWIQYNVKNSKK